jgi:hypothetical protein
MMGGSGGMASAGGATSFGGATPIGGAWTAGTPPELEPGVWADISPKNVDFTGTFGCTVVEVDPNNTDILYLSIDERGLWKTTDAGASWAQVGDTSFNYSGGNTTKLIDSPIDVRVDPDDSNHLYLTQGVRGSTLGFWVSTDGGENWTKPPGFVTVQQTATNDVTNMSVDPGDFKHVLLSSHSGWAEGATGILETTDGGETFIKRPPGGSWGGSLGVNFLHDPANGVGDSETWLISTDGDGFWRTTDSGDSWSQVATFSAVHGGNRTLYYANTGVVYAGANFQMARSTNNGLSWSLIGPTFPDGYYQVIGDGNYLYAQESNTGVHAVAEDQPYVTSPEDDGVTWTPYQGGVQKFKDGPYTMRFDSYQRILYSANWRTGLWALKVIDP